MAYSYNIDKDKPPDTGESPSLGAQRIRHFKEAIIERLKNLIWGFGSDSETDEGLKKAPLKTGTAPNQEADKIILYAKDVGDVAELFARDENGNEIQITSGGKLNPAYIARIAHGTYAGNGAASRDIPVTFSPDVIYMFVSGGAVNWYWKTPNLPGANAMRGDGAAGGAFGQYGNMITLGTNKFTVYYNGNVYDTNRSGNTYCWVAFKTTE